MVSEKGLEIRIVGNLKWTPDNEMGDEEDDEGLLWIDEQEVLAEATTSVEAKDSVRVAGLESELSRTRAELAEVRRELAAKVSYGDNYAFR